MRSAKAAAARRSEFLRAAAAGAVVMLGAASTAPAADTWINSAGTGSWNTPTNWADGTVPTAGESVLFPAPGPAMNSITLSSASAALTSAQFDNNYAMSGGTLSVPSVGVAVGKLVTIASSITASEFTKTGAGTLVLNGSNQLGGYININGGALRVSSTSNIGSNISGFKLTGALEAAGNFSTDKSIYLQGGAVRVLAGNTFTLTGSLQDQSGSSALIKEGDGTLVIGNHNSRTGTTQVNAGTLRLEQFAQSGYGMMTLGAATLELNSKMYSNPVTIGTASHVRGLGNSQVTLTFPNATDVFPTVSSDVWFQSNAGSGTITQGAFNVTFSGTATAGSIINIGAAGIVQPYAPNYQGTWSVNGGVLRAQNSLGTGTTPIEVNSGGTLDLPNFISRPVNANNGSNLRGIGLPATTIAPGANVTLEASSLSQPMFGGTISGGAGAMVNCIGPGRVELSGTNSYAGGWTVSGGTLRATSPTALGVGNSPIIVNGGVLDSLGSTTRDISLNGGSLRGVYQGTITIAPGANVALLGPASIGYAPNDLTGGDSNTYIHVTAPTPSQAVLLSQPSDVVGHWLIDMGVLDITADDRLGAATNTITLNPFGTLRIGASATFARDLNAQGGTIDNFGHSSSFEDVTGSGLKKAGTGTIAVNHVRIGTLSAGGTLKIKPNGAASGVSTVDTLTLLAGGRLDLTDNALIVRETAAGSWNGSAYTGVTGMVAGGYSQGTWSGSGIVTSMSDATDGILTTLAVALADDVGYAGGTFRGTSVAAGDVVVMYTWGGDADLDGDLDGDDYFQIDSNVASSGSVFGFNNGDFDYNGVIDGDDYFIIDSNIALAQTRPPFATGGGMLTAVPEPGGVIGVTLGALGLLRRRRGRGG